MGVCEVGGGGGGLGGVRGEGGQGGRKGGRGLFTSSSITHPAYP